MKEQTRRPEHGDGTQVRTSRDCGPPHVQTTRWGDWNSNDGTAETSAYTKARAAAALACGGSCPGTKTCKYVEDEAEILDEETRVNDRQETEYRFRARSKGGCFCE